MTSWIRAPAARFQPVLRRRAAIHWSWSFGLTPVGDRATRRVVRTRLAFTPKLLSLPAVVLLELVHFIMERGMLLGIKRRAEQSPAPLEPAGIHAEPGS